MLEIAPNVFMLGDAHLFQIMLNSAGEVNSGIVSNFPCKCDFFVARWCSSCTKVQLWNFISVILL